EIGTPVRCGEGIAKIWLDEVGIEPNKKWIALEVNGARIVAPNGQYVDLTEEMAGNETGFVVHRDIFDRTLAEDAVRAGAKTMLKCSATDVLKNEEGYVVGVKAKHWGKELELRAPVVIGADGFESQVGRWAGIDTKVKAKDVNTCLQYELVGIDIDKFFNEFHIGSMAPGGYVWIFNKSEDSANVGIGVNLGMVKERGEVKKYLDNFIASQPRLVKGQNVETVAGAVSVGMPLESVTTDGLMLVGDAARMIDALTGGGVANACIAGQEAARVAKEAHDAGDFSKEFFKAYEIAWRAKIEDQLFRNYIAKEKLLELSDDTINKVIDALQGYKIERITTADILRMVQERYPEIMKEFEDLL
ncbi:MAG: geranylgeranyl reductase family protein, partial [Thermoplasmata archaeon]|nr:geranylgeranyl reductase family protein [Thermoplasmata archaeon]